MDGNADEIINKSYDFLSDIRYDNQKRVQGRPSFFVISPWSERQQPRSKPVIQDKPIHTKPGGSSLLKATQSFLSSENTHGIAVERKTEHLAHVAWSKNQSERTPKQAAFSTSSVNKPTRPRTYEILEPVERPSYRPQVSPKGPYKVNAAKDIYLDEKLQQPKESAINRARSVFEPPPPVLRQPTPLKENESKNDNQFRNTLNEILKHQVESQRLSLTSSADLQTEPENVDECPEKYKTIKTLSKAAMRDKLEIILERGPPKKPSFRGRLDFESKRKEKVAALRRIEIEALAQRDEEDLNNDVRQDLPDDQGNVVARQKMLIKDINATIKLKNRYSEYN